jgi:hypothetical protein
MTPAPTPAPDQQRNGRPQVRLELKPESPTPTGQVDGGWWPRSTDLGDELPALLEVLAGRQGRIERVSYPLADWAVPARRITVDGTAVRLSGYNSQPVGTLDVFSAAGRTTLLVLSPDTAPDVAQRALSAAGRGGDTTTVTALLHGEPAGAAPSA